MDLVFEVIIELLLEGSLEICSDKKISKWIRYPLLAVLIIIFTIVIFGLLILGIYSIKENIIISLILIISSLLLLIGSIIKFKKYIEKKEESSFNWILETTF